ncbi:hypothetical protein HID58_053081 [Brassica napus]|uniref:PPM-type phosphatase domain-containing protein n=1 Tax=Brassica napus TaxID=3708 RepID=A0ABQ8ADP9_BRANA|nr:hypothetical protein HID58_053081 [Brassica napus]
MVHNLSHHFSSGKHLMLANAGDGRAVLCRNGEAIDMSQDHKPIYLPCELRRHHDPTKLALRSLWLDKFANLTLVV